MPALFSRLRRTLLLRMLARQTPAKLLAISSKRLERVFAATARSSSAYRTLLAEAGVPGSPRLSAKEILGSAPVLQKADLFERFPIRDLLAADVAPATLAGVLTSSGHGGSNFAFGVSTREQARLTPEDIDMGLQLAFGIDSRTTLLVNCLPMGVIFSSNAVCVANVSVREDMALAILRQAGPLFEQVVVCTDPLFSKRLLDYAAEQGFDWSGLRVNVILGEEMFSEDYRSYLAARLGVDLDAPDAPLIGSSMGVGELGLNLFFETAQTIALRRSLNRADPEAVLPSFFCYNPLRTYVEILAPGEDGVGDLVITMLEVDNPFPMIRYRTGDRARWVTDADRAALNPQQRQALAQQPFPMIAMLGRERDRIDEHWHVDHFKALLYRRPELAEHLSGAFVVSREGGALRLKVQLNRACRRKPAELASMLATLLDESARRRDASPPGVQVFAYAEFEHGMGLDYERKFRYYPAG